MSEKLPKVSVNVVTYNQENYIAECLESILSQTYSNIEIIVADDASTDNTVKIAKKYQKQYPNVIKIKSSKTNQGMQLNATKGLLASTGDYYCSFAGDDMMLPTKIQKQVELLEKNPDIVMCHTNAFIYDDNLKTDISLFNKVKSQIPFTIIEEILKKNFICAPTTMVRKKYLPKKYSVESGSVCDWYYFIEVLKNGNGLYINEPLIRYRRHENNLSSDRNKLRMLDDAIEALKHAKKELKITNSEIHVGFSWVYKAIAYHLYKKKNIKFIYATVLGKAHRMLWKIKQKVSL